MCAKRRRRHLCAKHKETERVSREAGNNLKNEMQKRAGRILLTRFFYVGSVKAARQDEESSGEGCQIFSPRACLSSTFWMRSIGLSREDRDES